MQIDFGVSMIVVSIISLAGTILIFMLNNSNWFKRENFKLQKSNILAENRLKLKKLQKDLDLQNTPLPNPPPEQPPLLDLLRNVDINTVKTLLGTVQQDDEDIIDIEPEGKPDIMEVIGKVVGDNPELVGKVINSIGNKGGEQNDQFPAQE